MDGASALVATLKQREDTATNGTWATGTITAFTTSTVTVNVAGASITCPFIQSYAPKVNSVVLLVGPPGQWFCLGTITPGG